MKRWLIGLNLVWGLGPMAWAQNQPVRLEADAQLQAIRQALVEATLDKPTKVNASAWIDDKGQLHETAHFQTDARIRGVRVLAYTESAENNPKASVELESLPWNIRVAKAAPGEVCEPPPQQWRQPLLIQSQIQSGFRGPELFASNALLKQLNAYWKELATQSGRWSIDAHQAIGRDAYQQAWLSQGEEPMGWQLHISLLPVRAQAQTAWYSPERLSQWVTGDTRRWTIQVVFGQKSSADSPLAVHWQRQIQIEVPDEGLNQQPERWVKNLMPSLQPVFARWLPQSGQDRACEPVQFSVNTQSGSRWVLQAGSGSGLKAGDRVLVVNATRVPGRLLEAGSVQQMAIAEVVRVGRRQSDLRPLAGSPHPGPGDWVALPL